jgi:hypothetical protein
MVMLMERGMRKGKRADWMCIAGVTWRGQIYDHSSLIKIFKERENCLLLHRRTKRGEPSSLNHDQANSSYSVASQ